MAKKKRGPKSKRQIRRDKLNKAKENLKNLESQDFRFPRPGGLTHQCQILNSLPPHQNKEKTIKLNQIKKYIISHYITNNFTWCGSSFSLPNLAFLLGESVNTIIRKMYRGELLMAGQLLDPKKTWENRQEVTGTALAWVWQDRIKILQHTHTLEQAQDGSYKPFISSEITKNLKNHLDSQKSILELLKAITSTTQVAIQINNQNGLADQNPKDTLTPNQAMAIIENQDGHNIDQKMLGETLESEYSDLPNIHALSQGGTAEIKTGQSLASIKEEQVAIDNHLANRELNKDTESE